MLNSKFKSLMKTVLIGFLFVFVLLGCSKDIQSNRILDGTWDSADFFITDYNGFKIITDCTGTMKFDIDGKKSKTGSYDFNLYFYFNGNPLNLVEKGTYTIGGGKIVTLLSSDGKKSSMTIAYKTKEDLVLEFPNVNYLFYRFVMKKEKK